MFLFQVCIRKIYSLSHSLKNSNSGALLICFANLGNFVFYNITVSKYLKFQQFLQLK